MLPPDGEGMYRTFLADAKVVNPNVRLIGLTATPYRMTTGTICGPENLLNHVCYEVGVRELVVQGYLCPLKSKAGRRKVYTSGLHIRGGEFIAGFGLAKRGFSGNPQAASGIVSPPAHNRERRCVTHTGGR